MCLSAHRWLFLGFIAPAVFSLSLPALAQTKPAPAKAQAQATTAAPSAPPAAPAPAAQQSNAAPVQTPGWTARCFSAGRQSQLECTLEQQVVVQQTGQQISMVTVRLPGDTKQPVMMIQLPLGLFLPAGLTLQVDEAKGQVLAIQSCDQRACYVGLPITPELLESLKKGQRLSLGIQSMNREPVTIAHTLNDFASQYQKIQ